MSVLIQGYQLDRLLYGTQVIKANQTPPNSGSSAILFTVTGGMVLVTSLVGRVTTVLSGTTGTISLGLTPTTGTAVAAGVAAATVVGGAEVGTKFAVVATIAGAATTLANGGASSLAGQAPFLAQSAFVADVGTIKIATTVATMTGAISWYLGYVPLDTGASVS